jgi:hypothetical protein
MQTASNPPTVIAGVPFGATITQHPHQVITTSQDEALTWLRSVSGFVASALSDFAQTIDGQFTLVSAMVQQQRSAFPDVAQGSSIGELTGEVIEAPSADLQSLLNRLFELTRLETGWDGANSRGASATALRNAAYTISELQGRPAPDIALLDGGGILFEWGMFDATYQIEWFSEGGGEYSAFRRDAIFLEGRMPDSVRDVHWRLRELMSASYYPLEPATALPT